MALIFDETFTGGAPVEAGATVVGTVTFPAGKSGEGALFGADGYISYNTENNFNFNKGTITFWMNPTLNSWELSGHSNLFLFEAFWTGTSKYLDFFVGPTSAGSGPVTYLRANFAPASSNATDLTTVEPFLCMSMAAGTWYKVSVFWDFTIAGTAQSFIVTKINDMFSNVAMVNAYDAGAIDAGMKMYLGNVPGRNRSCLALIDSVKIYDTVELTLPAGGMVALPYTYNPHDAASVTPMMNFLADAEVPNKFDTPANPVLDAGINPLKDVMFFERPAFEPTYANYVPPSADIVFGAKTTLDYSVPINEIENLFFGIYSRVELTDCQVTLSTDFTGAGTIDNAACDLRVVQNWFQGNRGKGSTCAAFPYYLPGLFLHNDQINGQNPSTGTRLDENTALDLLHIPVLPILDHVQTAMAAGTSKLFALKIPATATPGAYTATVTVVDAVASVSESLTINLTILPFALVSGNVKRTGSGPSYMQWDDHLGLDKFVTFETNLIEIKAMGFNWLFLNCGADGVDGNNNDSDYYTPLTFSDVVTEKCRLAALHGFEQVIIETAACGRNDTIWDWEMQQAITAMIANGFVPWLYGYDELGPGSGMPAIQTRQILAARAFNPNVKFITTCGAGGKEAMDVTATPLDGAWYTIINPAIVGSRDTDIHEGVYFQSRDYLSNRYEIGYGNYVRGFTAPISYGRMTASYCTMYNDCDLVATTKNRPYGYTYPAITAANVFHCIPSHRGEIIREGIKDEKYLKTWEYYYNRVLSSHPTVAAISKATIDALLVKYQYTTITACPPSHKASITQTVYATDRETIITEIGELRALTASQQGAPLTCGYLASTQRKFNNISGITQ